MLASIKGLFQVDKMQKNARATEAFLRDVGKELEEENVAVFAGAGLSAPSGYVNWSELLRPIASDLGLDVDKETDLVALAQYHINSNSLNRSQLNKRLIEEFSSNFEISENHRILSRLPISTYWTTNYDKLIERALEAAGKVADVKYTKKQLAFTKPRRDAVVYKMHGDIDHPDDAILSKDDYESYHVKMDHYINALSGDLISKTFIFIGFSFTDPNLDYILSRVRVSYDRSQRAHYCFLRRVSKGEHESEADFEYRGRKQDLFSDDLARFNIKTIFVDEYVEITNLLATVERRYRSRAVFVSGAAHEYGQEGGESAQRAVHLLSRTLVGKGMTVVSGFGLGIGSAVISGALEQIYMNPTLSNSRQLVLRPFPQQVFGATNLAETWTKYRRDMIKHAGIAIFLFGNKLNDGKVVNSNGMQEEFRIAREFGLVLIPVGVTGYVSSELWREARDEFRQRFSGNSRALELYENMNVPDGSLGSVLDAVVELIELVQK